MGPINPEDINRETILKLAKDHVIIDRVLSMLASPGYPINSFEDALILMVIHLSEANKELDLLNRSIITRAEMVYSLVQSTEK